MKTKRLFILMCSMGAIACAVGFYAGRHFFIAQPQQTEQPPNPNLAALWQAKLSDQRGHTQSLAQYQGSPLVVNFWAAWCKPCVEEMPALSDLQNKYAPKGVRFIGIAIDSVANVVKFEKKVKVNYPLYSAGYEGLELAHAMGNTQGGLPFTVFIDASGNIRSRLLGSVTQNKERLKELSAQLDTL